MKVENLRSELSEDWYSVLKHKIDENILKDLEEIVNEYKTKKVYPESNLTFRAFKAPYFNKIKAVIVGQDPYPSKNATGLAFDCGKNISPSMEMINEAYDDYNQAHFNTLIMDGRTYQWVNEGVMLLNTSLSVVKGKPGSHTHLWRRFIFKSIECLSEREEPIIFMLWGSHAHGLKHFIDKRHHILEAEYPMAAVYQNRRWKHNNHFKVCNKILKEMNKDPINW